MLFNSPKKPDIIRTIPGHHHYWNGTVGCGITHTLLWNGTSCQRLLYTRVQGHLLNTSVGLVLSGLKVAPSGTPPSPAAGVPLASGRHMVHVLLLTPVKVLLGSWKGSKPGNP